MWGGAAWPKILKLGQYQKSIANIVARDALDSVCTADLFLQQQELGRTMGGRTIEDV